MTCNNQQSFHLLTIFEHCVTSACLCCLRDVPLRVVCYKRQQRQSRSHHPSHIAGIAVFTKAANSHNKNIQFDEWLLPWHIG